MKIPAITRINFQKSEDFCAVRRSNLPFVNPFRVTMDSKRAYSGKPCLKALFSFDAEFVCVRNIKHIIRIHALKIQTHCVLALAARAIILPSLPLSKALTL